MDLYTGLLLDPFINILILIYNTVGFKNIGWTVIAMTVIFRIALLPVSISAGKTELKLQALKDEADRITKNEKNPQNRKLKLKDMFRENKVSPSRDLLSLLFQGVFFILLYQAFNVFFDGPTGLKHHAYDWNWVPESINSIFFKTDLSKTSIAYTTIASLSCFLYLFFSTGRIVDGTAEKFSLKWYNILMPILVFVVLMLVPASKSLFFIVSIVFSFLIKGILKASGSEVQLGGGAEG